MVPVSTLANVARPGEADGHDSAGAASLRQMVVPPTTRWTPYRTAMKGVSLWSAATPPEGGLHGPGGPEAARAAPHDPDHDGTNPA